MPSFILSFSPFHFFLLPAVERSTIDQCNRASGMRRKESVSFKGEETKVSCLVWVFNFSFLSLDLLKYNWRITSYNFQMWMWWLDTHFCCVTSNKLIRTRSYNYSIYFGLFTQFDKWANKSAVVLVRVINPDNQEDIVTTAQWAWGRVCLEPI